MFENTFGLFCVVNDPRTFNYTERCVPGSCAAC